jgi:hypothetical protein
MDDIWEDLHGLDSTVNDAYTDTDGDGLFNIAEFLIGTDPSNWDTNGDGEGDGVSVVAMRDPLVSYSQAPQFYLANDVSNPYEIRWESEVGFTYVVETNDTPGSVGWGVLAVVPGSATGESVLTIPQVQTRLFLRVKKIGTP